MSGSSSPQGVTQTTVNNDPWSGAQPYLQAGLSAAGQLANTPRQFFPGSTVVPFSGQTEAGLGNAERIAGAGSPEIDAARMQNTMTSAGGFLGAGNPYFGAMMDRIQNQVQPRVNSMFANAGRSGGSAGHAEAMARALSDAGAGLAFQNYGQERGFQQQAAQQAPGLYQSAFAPSEMMRQVGSAREGLAGAHLQDRLERFNFAQDEPRERVRELMALAGGGNFGGTQTSQQPIFGQSPLATGLGTAATLSAIAGNLWGKGGVFR